MALHYLDTIMSRHVILPDVYESYAVACLIVAAKAIELDEKIPFFSKLQKYCGHSIKLSEIKPIEKKVLELLDWELQTCTAVDILYYYLSQGILFSNDEISSKDFISSFNKVLAEKNSNSSIQRRKEDLEKGLKSMGISEKSEYVKLEKIGDNSIQGLLSHLESQALNLLLVLIKGTISF